MDVTATASALNSTGIPTLVMVPPVMAIAIVSVAGIRWLYKKLNRKK